MAIPSLQPVSETLIPISKDDTQFIPTSRQKQTIRSLIPPVIPSRLKSGGHTLTLRTKRRNSTSSSIQSVTSSLLSRPRKTTQTPTPSLATLPSELLTAIFTHLDQRTLHALLLTSSHTLEIAAKFLYSHPQFASTYRFAQFSFEVSHHPHYATLVRTLDLSSFHKLHQNPENQELLPLAGWREFKYRHQDTPWQRSTPFLQTSHFGKTSTHPPPSPFLKSYHRTRDIPIGALCHVLTACTSLKALNLSRLQLAGDFLVLSPLFPPTATTKMVFVSDVPKSWTWASDDLKPVYADDIIRAIVGLSELEVLKARACITHINDVLFLPYL
ncbi:hypothetical protein HYFRA_00001068 [Hymenoscyphus fraxineus]|uniref:F-box domain-containing protein n=1 Tax=Hymenoscyphus fraxineus TaxID=746836 RepID=A0A9N9KST8_9HELO|nr:hypothetical protein HYFRA_00001068 [Hymenoscyphus fraxineus]